MNFFEFLEKIKEKLEKRETLSFPHIYSSEHSTTFFLQSKGDALIRMLLLGRNYPDTLTRTHLSGYSF